MSPTCKVIFEPENIDNASPATVSRNGMVYMSSSGLNWKPVVRAWLKKRSVREQELFQKLFDESFGPLYSWGTQNLHLVISVLQCNITLQVLKLLEGRYLISIFNSESQIFRVISEIFKALHLCK